MVTILIAPTTPGRMLISEIFLVISEVPIWIIFRETVKHMLDAHAAMKMLVTDVVIMLHAGGVSVVEDKRYHKLILIGLTPDAKDMAAEDAVHIMALHLEEERIDSYVVSHRTYVGYLNGNHDKTFK